MLKSILFLCALNLLACHSTKKLNDVPDLPPCLGNTIKAMAADSSQGLPQSVTRYHYKGKTVYYVVSSCCDKFSIVYDDSCNVLGHPDGGFTGRGDGNMSDFHQEVTDGKVVWRAPSADKKQQ